MSSRASSSRRLPTATTSTPPPTELPAQVIPTYWIPPFKRVKGRACEPQVRAALNAHRLCLWAGEPGGLLLLPLQKHQQQQQQIPRDASRRPPPFSKGATARACGWRSCACASPHNH
ncbi:hypothetical protein [Lysobacter gummosus]|uniref:hypothetical protein n=1 Tax=Lysobacter gummosus TaxID=262324 RepID=UPI0036331707